LEYDLTKALIALEDGSLFEGKSIGVSGNTTGEVVFNTAITGYQEIILTDLTLLRRHWFFILAGVRRTVSIIR